MAVTDPSAAALDEAVSKPPAGVVLPPRVSEDEGLTAMFEEIGCPVRESSIKRFSLRLLQDRCRH